MATQNEQRIVEIIVNGQKADASLRQMQASAAVLNNQIRNLTPGTAEFIERTRQFQEVNGRIRAVRDEIQGTESVMTRLTNSVGGLIPIMSVAFVASKVVDFFSQSSAAAKDFEKSLSTLSSITGATGKDLEYFSEQAQLIGATTTLSATQAVEAFKMIGGAKPELLANKEALAAVTKEAITLAEAAGIDLTDAAAAVTSSLNMFGLEASQTKDIVNALAAGSLEGSAEIADINASLKNFGVVASSSNVSINQSVALIELLGEKSIKGAEAGTGLRNVLTKMATAQALPKEALEQLDKFGVDLKKVSDNTVPFNERLREFSKISGDATAMAKVFGAENLVVGQTILSNVTKFEKLNGKIDEHVKTGTVAAKQAKTNTDNLDGALTKLGSATEAVQLSIGQKLNSVLLVLVKSITSLLLGLKELPQFLYENRDIILALGVALVSFNSAQIVATAATLYYTAVEKGRAIATRASAIAQGLLNVAMVNNPIGAVVAVLTLLVGAFIAAYNRSETLRGGIAGLWEWLKIVGKSIYDVFSVLNPAKLLKMLATGDFSEFKNAFSNFGAGAGEAFTKGYNDKIKSEKLATPKPGVAKPNAPADKAAPDQPTDATKSSSEEGLSEKEQKALAKAEKKAEAERQKQEAHLQKMEELKQDYANKSLAADQALESLRTAVQDKFGADRLAKLQTQQDKEIQRIEKLKQAVLENEAITGEEKQALIQKYNDQELLLKEDFAQRKTELEEKLKEEEKEKKEKELEKQLEKVAEEEEAKLEAEQQKFLMALETEAQKEAAFLDIKKQALQQKLDLLTAAGMSETAQAQKLKTDILAIEKEKTEKTKQLAADKKDFERAMTQSRIETAAGLTDTIMGLLDKESGAYKVAKAVRKGIAVTEIALNLSQELSSIAKAAAANPLNAVTAGAAGVTQTAVQSGLAIARAVAGTIKVLGFEKGGFTGGGARAGAVGMLDSMLGLSVSSSGQLIDSQGLKVAGIVHENEWVGPKWMNEHPRYANVIGWLESSRQRGFVDGGFTTPSASAPAAPLGDNSQAMLQYLAAILEENRSLRAEVSTWQRTLQVHNNVGDTQRGIQELIQLRNDASVG